MPDLPKNIFTYWHQGFDQAPRLVRMCIKRLTDLHPDWEVHLLDKDNLEDLIPPFPMPAHNREGISLAAWSDLVRTQLLLKYGGVWMDPTVFCNQALDRWLPEVMDAGIFLFVKPGRDRLVSSWFIAAEPENALLEEVERLMRVYWSGKRFRNLGRSYSWFESQLFRIINRNASWPRIWFSTIFTRWIPIQPYFFYHYSYSQAIMQSSIARKVWQSMPKVSADGPHSLLRVGLLNSVTLESKNLILEPTMPVFKLNWKSVPENFPEKSVVQYLEQITHGADRPSGAL